MSELQCNRLGTKTAALTRGNRRSRGLKTSPAAHPTHRERVQDHAFKTAGKAQ